MDAGCGIRVGQCMIGREMLGPLYSDDERYQKWR
jgi:hypothetical protein